MAENTAPAKCSEAVYQAARAAGLLIVTTADELVAQKFADALQTAAYAEGRKDQQEADERENAASRLIDAWVSIHGRPISWERAVEIIAIVTKLPDTERARLLALSEGA